MSQASTTVVVSAKAKVGTYLTIACTPANPEVGEMCTIGGFLKRSDNNAGLGNKNVVVTGIPVQQTIGTTAAGEYFATGVIWDAEGTYPVTAEFAGDADFEGCEKESDVDADLLKALD